jgi:hypothetical protein
MNGGVKLMTVRCIKCLKGINSMYIRTGGKSLLKKVGYYCSHCDMPLDLDQKPYTVIEKPYTVDTDASSRIIAPFSEIKSLGRDLDPGPLPYQGNALPG